jgi:hypothetical protein
MILVRRIQNRKKNNLWREVTRGAAHAPLNICAGFIGSALRERPQDGNPVAFVGWKCPKMSGFSRFLMNSRWGIGHLERESVGSDRREKCTCSYIWVPEVKVLGVDSGKAVRFFEYFFVL